MSTRDSMTYDVVIVGAGPAGLAAAIRLKQLAIESGRELGVCVLEKGSEVGAHILSGAVVDPIALDELLPEWRDLDSPLTVPVTENHHWILTKNRQFSFPHIAIRRACACPFGTVNPALAPSWLIAVPRMTASIGLPSARA